MNLIKAYDNIDWGFLRLLLLQVGIDFEIVSWIMDCVGNIHFSIMVNGSLTRVFKGQRGLRQGCPLSPLLFLLVINGLSRLIGEAKQNGSLRGVKVSHSQILTHILFVDDVLLFSGNSRNDWACFYKIVNLLCFSSGMEISGTKSCFIAPGGHLADHILDLFPFQTIAPEDGLRYLGYTLKPNVTIIWIGVGYWIDWI